MSRILVDGHGGDRAPRIIIEAFQRILAGGEGSGESGQMKLGIVGQPEVIIPALDAARISDRVEIVPAAQTIDMCESPGMALRRKKDSSIHVGSRQVRDGHWDAFVSAGNTGALMAISRFILKTLPGIDRPAIASMIPAIGGQTLLLDAGANVDSSSEHLVQFAVMGSCYMQAAEGINSPRVGLLNIGSEDIKGTDVVKVAAAELKEMNLNFVGNVEGTDLFLDTVDVVVCDGFVGNVALKTMEGVAHFIMHSLRRKISGSLSAKAGMLLARRAMRRLKSRIDPAEYNGAPLLGLNGIVVKSHGGASTHAFTRAIMVAQREVDSKLGAHIVEAMNEWTEA
ncbi:MAG: phosphate acyltransferase PlsX [Mariprofundaceae bacterium]|nr:phosphate acyltransferase PlsX [Mariprofundaceae bacterium]